MAGLTFKTSNALLSVPSLFALAVIGYVIHCFVQHAHLRHFQGPRTVGFSKLWLLKVMRSGTMHLSFTETNKKYGAPMLFLFLFNIPSRQCFVEIYKSCNIYILTLNCLVPQADLPESVPRRCL